jgi:hypothetical protein
MQTTKFNLFPTFEIEDIIGFDRNEDSIYEIYSQEIEVNIICKLTDKGELYRLPDAVCSKFNVVIQELSEELVTRRNFTSGEEWAAETKSKTTLHTFSRNSFDIHVDSIITDSFREMLEGFAEMEIDLDTNIIKI